ncbi:MAG: MarR family transcriptional regulator [Pseudomonadota bacterium]
MSDPTRFVDDYLLYLLAAASAAASDQFHAEVRSRGLKIPEWRVLACLDGEDGAIVTRLAKLCLFEQSRLTKTIDQMAERGLVLRRADPDDARRVRVFLTEMGRTLASELTAAAKTHETEVLDAFAPDQAAAFKASLKELLASLE